MKDLNKSKTLEEQIRGRNQVLAKLGEQISDLLKFIISKHK